MKHLLNNLDVAAVRGADRYPTAAPYHPPELYPEYPHDEDATDASNGVYAMVRDCFRLLGMDQANFGTPRWNPLGELIRPGQRVLIKPNFVLHFNAGGGPLEAVITHPSVLRAITDYVLIALDGRGEIAVGDAPQMNCDLPTLYRATGMDRVADYLRDACARRGVKFQDADFRQEQTFYKYGIVWERRPVGGAADRGVKVTLGRESFMESIDSERLYGADYCRRETVGAHRPGRHEYLIAPAVLRSDVVISVPKLKVHRKVGTTLNLKNMVGINTDKNHLAHYRVGPKSKGGDEVSAPRLGDQIERTLSDMLLGTNWRMGKYPFLAWRALRRIWQSVDKQEQTPVFTYGNWHGNDTAWRMVLDLNRILLFADSTGAIQTRPTRAFFSVIDGVVGGEGEGPLHPDPYPSGVVLAGYNPLGVDWAATRLMGFDPEKIPMYANALAQMQEWVTGFEASRIRLMSNVSEWENVVSNDDLAFRFRAAAGWRGRIERYEPAEPARPAVAASPGLISQ